MNYRQAKNLKKNDEVEVIKTGKRYLVISTDAREGTHTWITVRTTGGDFYHNELV